MISQKEMLDIIITEVIEKDYAEKLNSSMDRPDKKYDSSVGAIDYGLRLVRLPDGSFKWED